MPSDIKLKTRIFTHTM